MAPIPGSFWTDAMKHYLISFPSSAMRHLDAEQLDAAAKSSREVIDQAKAAGAYVFGGGINEAVSPVMVAGDGQILPGTYAETARLNGGYCVLKLASRREAEDWAAKIAGACRCAQELREFMFDPES